jgi:hypothetical protein
MHGTYIPLITICGGSEQGLRAMVEWVSIHNDRKLEVCTVPGQGIFLGLLVALYSAELFLYTLSYVSVFSIVSYST